MDAAKKEVQRTVLGTVQPGDTIPVPYGWQKAGRSWFSQLQLDLQVRTLHSQPCAAVQ